MATVHEVADYFLALAEASGDDGEGLTHLKLQKLLYYAQGFHLAIVGAPLFQDRIQAWEHGPVVRSIWERFRDAGRSIIPAPQGGGAASLPHEQIDLLNDVWNTYGQFSAWKLREMTHQEPPWKDAYQPGKNVEISNESMRRYFVTQLA